MAAAILDAPADSSYSGKCNLTKNCAFIDSSCSIENSLKYFISCIHVEIWWTEFRWPRWPVLLM